MGKATIIASGTIWSILYNVLNALYGFIAVPFLINYYGKAEYGLISIAQSVNLYIQLLDWGFNSTNVRFFSVWLEEHNFHKVSKLFKTSLSLYTIIGIINAAVLIIVAIFSPVIFNTTADQDVILKQLLFILAAAALLNWVSSCFDQLIRATENVAWIQKRSFIPKVFQIIVLFATIWLGWSIQWYFFLTTFALFLILPLSYTKIKKEVPFVTFCPSFDWPVLKEVLPYIWNILLFNLFKFSFINLCPLFIGIRLTMESVADYKVICSISSLPSMVTGVVLGALLPSVSKLVSSKNAEAYYRVAYRGTKFLSIAVCFCVFGLISVEKDLLAIYAGESSLFLIKWLYGLTVLCVTNHILCVSSLILAGTDISALSKMTGVSSLLSLIFVWFLLPSLSIGGAVIAQALYEVLQMLFYYLYYMPVRMNLRSSKMLKAFLPSFLIGLISFLFTRIFSGTDNHLVNILLYGLAFSCIYLLSSYYCVGKEDRIYLKSMLINE